MFQFPCRFAVFINFLSFKPDTENNAHFDAVSSKSTNFDEVQFFYIKRIPKFTIFGTHNLQTFTHNTLILTHSVVLASFHFYSTSSECCTSYSRIVCLSDHSSVTHWHCVSMTEATVYDYAHVNPAADVSVAVPSLIWQLTLCRH